MVMVALMMMLTILSRLSIQLKLPYTNIQTMKRGGEIVGIKYFGGWLGVVDCKVEHNIILVGANYIK